MVRPIPPIRLKPHAERFEGIIDVSRPNEGDRTFLHGVASLAGAIGIALLVVLAMLLVGLPIALSARGVLELLGWVFGVR